MEAVTLEKVVAEHTRLAEMIEALKVQASAQPTVLTIPEAHIELAAGELYAGLLFDANGTPTHHLILLPGQAEDVTWQAAKDWAAGIGGELPTRQEQSLLFTNLKHEFEARYHWSGEQYSDSHAWCQVFGDGSQGSCGKSAELRARAVRRLSV
jgi:hypothetical protein